MKEIDPQLLARQIDAFCAANGIQKQEFTDRTGISTATLSQWRKGKYSPGAKSITILEEFTNMPIEALLYGHPSSASFIWNGEDKETPASENRSERGCYDLPSRFSALDSHGRDAVLAVLEVEEKRMVEDARRSQAEIVSISPQVRTIRHYFSTPAAGLSGMEAGEDYEDIPLPDDAPNNADYCLTVSGDSMEPYIQDGSMVYVLRDAPISDFDVGIFMVDGVAFIKQLCHGYNGEIYLLSANPKREKANITIYPDSDTRLEYRGKVILKKKLPQPVYG